MTFFVEVTDTFAGEANYCWVNRYYFTLPEGASDLSVVRVAKELAGWTGLRCARNGSADYMELRPTGRAAPCWIMFITWVDDVPEGYVVKHYSGKGA